MGIYRLPTMAFAARTGVTNSGDVGAAVFAACTLERCVPHKLQLLATDPSDAVSSALVQIARRPNRKHCIYQLARPYRALAPDLGDLAAFGLELERVKYSEFRRRCLARGPQSPLAAFWPIMEQFETYWMTPQHVVDPAEGRMLLCDQTIVEDLGFPVKWPDPKRAMLQSAIWVMKAEGGAWPYLRPDVKLDAEVRVFNGA